MSTTVFLRLLEATDKAPALLAALQGPCAVRFEFDSSTLENVPRSPFAYWAGPSVIAAFKGCAPMHHEDAGRIVCSTNPLNEDFRYARVQWEVKPSSITVTWISWAKGGAFSPFYFDIHTLIHWSFERGTFFDFIGTANRPMERPAGAQHFLRPGLTWPRRTNGLSFRVLPRGCIFADKGPATFAHGDDPNSLLSVCGIVNSKAFDALVALQLARTQLAQSFEVGLIQQTPIPHLGPADERAIAALARRSWSLRRANDSVTDISHAFVLPALLQTAAFDFVSRAAMWADRVAISKHELGEIQTKIDELSFKLYGVSDDDRHAIEQGFGGTSSDVGDETEDESDDDAEETEAIPVDAEPLTVQLISWSVGIAFGRFDLRLATGERPLPPEPDPFDPLPACSPGMLTGADGLPLAAPPPNYPIAFPTDGILVDDPGHDRDLLARIHQVFTVLFADHADDRLQEAVSILDPSAKDLRPWLRRTFFEEHIQRYSKSRRKAPIYWRLGTPSGSYSVWIYLHRFNKDTLHRVLNDHVAPKLRYESNKLESLRSEAGPSPTPSQRKTLDAQETFVDELRGFSDEVQRVAPLWDPDLDDGVVINASFLHRLFAHTRAWQKECESHWQKLQKGEYDWAHLAMRLWPERVVPKCTDDRSLAIAHGLENVLWLEGTDGKWRPQHVTDAEIAALVQERTRAAVKDALRRMGETPEPVVARKVRAAVPAGEPKQPKKAKAAHVPGAVQISLGLPGDPTPADLNAVRAALHETEDGLPKSDLLAACGLDEEAGAAALAALVNAGEVAKIGAGRGTRYRLGGGE